MSKIDANLELVKTVWETTDECLKDHDYSKSNLQFPDLMSKIVLKLELDEKMAREMDAIVRFHVRRHSDYGVTRGAHGGIVCLATKRAKEEAKLEKLKAKNEMAEQIQKKIESLKAQKEVSPVDSEEKTLEEENVDE